jgi:hypothetical protein
VPIPHAIRFPNAPYVIGCFRLMAGRAKPLAVFDDALATKLNRQDMIRLPFADLQSSAAFLAASVGT